MSCARRPRARQLFVLRHARSVVAREQAVSSTDGCRAHSLGHGSEHLQRECPASERQYERCFSGNAWRFSHLLEEQMPSFIAEVMDRIAVRCRTKMSRMPAPPEGGPAIPKNQSLIPPHYGQPDSSGLSVEISLEDTEYNIDFFRGFHVVLNALDNVSARRCECAQS